MDCGAVEDFSLNVPLFVHVEKTQCEERDGGHNTETERRLILRRTFLFECS